MKTQIVLGTLFGDCGKGLVTQWLTEEAIKNNENPVVIRYSGGPQAAHTVIKNSKRHICSSFGSGVLLGIPTIYFESVMIDPICLWNEVKSLHESGALDKWDWPKIYIFDYLSNPIILPWDVFEGRKNKKVLQDGTCGKGIYQCFKRNTIDHEVLSLQWYFKDPILFWDILCRIAKDYYGQDILEDENKYWIRVFEESLKNLMKHGIVEMIPKTKISEFNTLIFEGSQGLLLDMDNGFSPNTTPSKVGLNGIPSEYLDDAEVYLVIRSYLTRHGNGYTPLYPVSSDMCYDDSDETNVYNQYQGHFKLGYLEFPLIWAACNRHRLDNYNKVNFNLFISHLDKPEFWSSDESKLLGVSDRNVLCYLSPEQIKESFLRNTRMTINKVYGSWSPDGKQIKQLL